MFSSQWISLPANSSTTLILVNIDKIVQTPPEWNCYTGFLSRQKEEAAKTHLLALLSNILSCVPLTATIDWK